MPRAACAVLAGWVLAFVPVHAAASAPDFRHIPCGLSSVAVSGVRTSTGVTAKDITLRIPGGAPQRGEIVTPSIKQKHGAVLFVHWLGDPKTTNHTEFHADAMRLATHGITSLSIDAMWAAPGWFRQMGADASADYTRTVTQVIALRCALDVLSQQPGVDASRIAYVGHDFGAMFGALLAGVDARPKWYVLMAGTDSLTTWYLFGKHPADRSAYEATLAPLDILSFLRQSKARAFLFQFAQNDSYIPVENALRFAMASGLPRTIEFYDAPHSLANSQATADRLSWLLSKLLP